MSIADPPTVAALDIDVPVQPPFRPLTASDLEAFPSELPSAGLVDYELDNGRLVIIMAPPGGVHGSVQHRISGYLFSQGELKGHGRGFTETGVILWRNPDRVVSPDVAFIANKSLPTRLSPEGYLETIPGLVVEIRSKGDSVDFVRRKVQHYLKAGVEIVCVVDPTTKTVAIHAAGKAVVTLSESDVLTLPTIIPDFSLPLADVFRE
jgi:Uma2 family endonuclease